MKKIKNKLTIAVLLFLGITVFMSCEKTKQEPRSINNESIINDFKANLNENKKIIEEKNKDNIEKSTVDVAFPLNPYDIQGQKHNEILTYFKNNNLIGNTSTNDILKIISNKYDVKFKYNYNHYDSLFSAIKPIMYNNDYSYNSLFINSLNGIPSYEKTIVNYYFI